MELNQARRQKKQRTLKYQTLLNQAIKTQRKETKKNCLIYPIPLQKNSSINQPDQKDEAKEENMAETLSGLTAAGPPFFITFIPINFSKKFNPPLSKKPSVKSMPPAHSQPAIHSTYISPAGQRLQDQAVPLSGVFFNGLLGQTCQMPCHTVYCST